MREISTRARLSLFVALGVMIFASASADAQQMYRWVDKDGRVHYTQNPPPRDAAKSIEQRRLNPVRPPDGSEPMPFSVRQAVENFPVTLYTSPDCARGCTEARALLAKRGIPYREVSITDPASRDVLQKATGDTQVPSMLVGRTVEKGFEEGSFNSILDTAGYPRTSMFTGKPPAFPAPKPQAKPAPTAPAEPPQSAAEGTPDSPAAQAGAPQTPASTAR